MMNLNQTLKAKDFPESNPDEVTQFVKICGEFSENSSIHGMKQLAKEKKSPVERYGFPYILSTPPNINILA